ncbi:MAG: F0F1 ATP synthase subunit gamma [Lachnospiraceae bacterium]|nr:F0F1 ATP synthase subunit gamma [Lachnospiraceae bacterium]
MNVKNIVKVMNFHALLRVDKSRKIAKKYAYLGDAVADMIDNIVNNRNIQLDFTIFKVDQSLPVLNIYLGGDLGFCANLNSNITRELWQDEEGYKIVIGRKIHAKHDDERVLLALSREEFEEDRSRVFSIVEDAFLNKRYSKINLIYNHYYSSSEVEFKIRPLYPLPRHLKSDNTYDEDFSYEGEIEPLLEKLIVLYLQYELIVAGEVSSAALNITRQNTTSESLKKIDEREEQRQMVERRETREKEFGKVLDNYTKLSQY